MPKADQSPQPVRFLRFFGMDLSEVGDQMKSNCPFCLRDGKFYASVETGLWDCKTCGERGNQLEFLRKLVEFGSSRTDDFDSLVESRGTLGPEPFREWGVLQSPITGEWLVPGRGITGKVEQVYRWAEIAGGKRVLLASPGFQHALFTPGYQAGVPGLDTAYVCEGPWDGMCLWEVLGASKSIDDGLRHTGNPGSSLLASSVVLATPGCNVFQEAWATLLSGKDVVLLYDSDHPQQNGSRPGFDGMRRVSEVLSRSEVKPRSVKYLSWGKDGYDPDRPTGFDLRDFLTQGETTGDRVKLLDELLKKVEPIPASWIPSRAPGTVRRGGVEQEVIPCRDWESVQNAWKKAMKWTDGLDRALSFMLASAASVRIVGDQLWGKVTSPPSGGKSSLCEALAIDREHVVAKSVIRGFHSGFQIDRKGEEDSSLLNQLRDKTLVTKDGDTLLQSPNLPQILAEARDVYDRVSRTHYRNKMSKDYEGINMTWILCGTASLRALDDSELGQRFLDCVIMDRIDEDLEDDINRRKLGQFRALMAYEPGINGDGSEGPEMVEAKRLTAGYLKYLRGTIEDSIRRISMSDSVASLIDSCGKTVAYLRSRPSTKQTEEVSRELSTRLVIQHGKLAYCLAAVLGKRSIDDEVVYLVCRVASDTARGRTMRICRELSEAGSDGLETKEIASATGETELKEKELLHHLRKIGGVEVFKVESKNSPYGRQRWKLTARMKNLYASVVEKWK